MIALVLAVAASASAPPPPATFAYNRLRLGDSVAKMISDEGPPNVNTTDVGHVWSWEKGGDRIRLTTDDNGVVRMIDILPAPSSHLALALPGMPTRKLIFGTLGTDDADAQLGIAADVKGSGNFPDSGARADFRAYPLNGNQSAVLLFDDATKRLAEVFYGDRGVMARSGLLADSSGDTSGRFSAPILEHEGSADYPPTIKQGDAFLRLSVDKRGTVANAEIFVTSGDPQLDRAALVSARHDVFTPGNVAGTPVDAIVFVRQEFRQVH